MKKSKKKNIARNALDLGGILGLTEVECALMNYKAKISSIAVEAINSSGMSVNDIVLQSGVARSKVSAVKNGATVSVSIDLLVKIIAAAGMKLKIEAA
jgi:predicted XRE-type DNA-binding protein